MVKTGQEGIRTWTRQSASSKDVCSHETLSVQGNSLRSCDNKYGTTWGKCRPFLNLRTGLARLWVRRLSRGYPMQDGSRRVCHNLLGCLMSHAVQFVLQAILCDSESCPNHYINGPTPQLVLGPTSLPLPDETTNNKFTSNVQQQCLTHTPTPSPLESSSTSSCKGFNNALNRATRWKAVEYGQRSWLITNESATFHILAVKHVLSHTRTV